MVKPQTPNLKDECSSHSVPAMICNKCKKDKDEAEFPFKNKETGKRTEAKIKEFYENYKATHPCIVCGESAPECIDFHHLRDKEAL